jgi:hypothetical protein
LKFHSVYARISGFVYELSGEFNGPLVIIPNFSDNHYLVAGIQVPNFHTTPYL